MSAKFHVKKTIEVDGVTVETGVKRGEVMMRLRFPPPYEQSSVTLSLDTMDALADAADEALAEQENNPVPEVVPE